MPVLGCVPSKRSSDNDFSAKQLRGAAYDPSRTGFRRSMLRRSRLNQTRFGAVGIHS